MSILRRERGEGPSARGRSPKRGFGCRTGTTSIWDQFVGTAVGTARLYQRAAGFFDSSVFEAGMDRWCELIQGGGIIQIVCSEHLSQRDIAAIYTGLYESSALTPIGLEGVRSWVKGGGRRDAPGTRFLAWGIAVGVIDMYIATPTVSRPALYHEKFAIIQLKSGEILGFSGSANETAAGFHHNFERVEVFSSSFGEVDTRRLGALSTQFEALVNDRTFGLSVRRVQLALQDGALKVRPPTAEASNPVPLQMPTPPPEFIRLPPGLKLRDHQRAAVEAWMEAGGRATFAMATGAGKTISALAAAQRVFERKGGPFVLVVVAPFLVLVDQWLREMRNFGLNPIRCAHLREDWEPRARAATYAANRGVRPVLSLVTTNSTFASEGFQDVLASIQVRTMLVADEVHNLGARRLRECLPARIALRLGLSATPSRFMDEDGTKAVEDYFGAVVAPFGIREALSAVPPVLCAYDYHPILVELTPDEADTYIDLTRQLARYVRDPDSAEISQAALSLLLQRARLIAGAGNKLAALRREIAPFASRTHTLIYCGDGNVETDEQEPDESEARKQVDEVARILNAEFRMAVRRYTYKDSPDVRSRALEDFRSGAVQALAAIRCLDEGVDIPAVERAFILASSSNPRQFIQRRGRVLRPAPGKTKAEIFDFVVAPPAERWDVASPEFRLMRGMLEKEMRRVVEFCATARNRYGARLSLASLLARFDLSHL